jgi:Cof subfamily protein (haloacid dehalogenase superfamily)
MRKDIRLILSDIDGTLVGDARAGVPEVNKRALLKASESGIIVALCSGRPERGIRPLLEEIGITGPVGCYGGALTKDEHGTILDGHTMDKELCLGILSIGRTIQKDGNITFFMFDSDDWYKERQDKWSTFEEEVSCEGVLVPSIEESVRQTKAVYKLLAISDDTNTLLTLRDAILSAYGKVIDSYLSSPNYLEIMLRGIDKGIAGTVLAKHYNIGKEQVMAVGDYYNDIGMFREAGYRVAMGNAPEEVKKAADIVTASNVDGGLGKAIMDIL